MSDIGSVLALIPARGGSKGLPGKNIRPLKGKPLIGWSIEAARASRYVSRIVVSSDDEEILAVARDQGAETPFRRPASLAGDATPGMDVVLHALDQLAGFEWVVLLQPTSPLRLAADIDAAIEQCLKTNAPACVSVCEAPASPWWMFEVGAECRMRSFLPAEQRPVRRQDLPDLYALNGAVYVAKTEWLRMSLSFLTEETVAYVMPPARSVDIDTLFDFQLAECLLENH
ncbi:MAG: acylneuraminate cytidylyltransferase [Halothiobacillus sp. 14-56-357]|uniref:acylneuraminate cytidylyltransferase family protein n=1 Tax=Halothiobacillus sp. 15-55-196 TaxID=1970382 RepID=UPI000BD48F35|nr:acylneuraminate cytidylyltransferase family protein [Halothiobacillus sp. 15-55-196]OZB36047.1 MAG: acylneuraminate cytidylyltransferase [Halothiobacillus sp. 15-55-196]OZB56388.1 MAG: acylneuraminate cytidylyltransferase [Halothiobacillus sp. 14-56-357]OZB76956.1 MAG: acylneuraminate cytidylyltransferase [Halothiobacillus sp. 13-55-115]